MKGWTIIDYLSLFLFTFVLTITVMTFIYPPVNRLDFSIYLLATKAALLGQTLYPLLIGNLPFTYPPSIFPFFFPFLFINAALATSIWNGISLIFLVMGIYLVIKKSGIVVKKSYLLLIFSTVILLEPVRETFLFGQNNAVVLFCILLAFLFSQKKSKKHQLISGLFLGIAAALKVFPLFLLFYFIADKKWENFSIVLGVFLSFLFLGTFGHIHYIQEYITYASIVLTPIHLALTDQSFSTFFLYYFPFLHFMQTIITGGFFMLFILLSWHFWKRRKQNFLSNFLFFSQLLAGTILIITPLAWMHHLVFLIPLCLALFFDAIVTKKKIEIVLFITVFLLTFINGEDIVLFFQSYHLPFVSLAYFHATLGLFFLFIFQFSGSILQRKSKNISDN